MNENPFGLAYPRPEGTPVHPDDWWPTNLSAEDLEKWHAKQMRAYNHYWGIKDATD